MPFLKQLNRILNFLKFQYMIYFSGMLKLEEEWSLKKLQIRISYMRTFLVLILRLSNIWEFKILSFLYTHTAMIGLLLKQWIKGVDLVNYLINFVCIEKIPGNTPAYLIRRALNRVPPLSD